MKELRDPKDLTIHDVQPISDENTHTSERERHATQDSRADWSTTPPAEISYFTSSKWPESLGTQGRKGLGT